MLVYVAGPYTSDPEGNTEKAMEVGAELLLYGFYPFIPHLTHYFDKLHSEEMTYEKYLEWDLAIMLRCDIVLRIPGESSGAERELMVARAVGLPIAYNMDEVIKFYASQGVSLYAE